MSQIIVDRIKRQLASAEGYLALNLPDRALEILQSRAEWATMQFEASFLTGETLRTLGRHREALKPLETAASLRPGDVAVAIALGWCYKRTHRLAQAIDSLARALRQHPEEPILHYNLACYWSLANNPRKALESLATALRLEPEVRSMIAEESDLDAIRSHPEFERVIGPAVL
jgi:tetratricopeptide (TPR) repeat protein